MAAANPEEQRTCGGDAKRRGRQGREDAEDGRTAVSRVSAGRILPSVQGAPPSAKVVQAKLRPAMVVQGTEPLHVAAWAGR